METFISATVKTSNPRCGAVCGEKDSGDESGGGKLEAILKEDL